ncbi:hypothetical protein [Spongiimicrobium salis]|uniref:hypothetical protein n=1 Tax=Spongiimicrobium salis TaxID=1667022 RepID=UPI00374CA28F
MLSFFTYPINRFGVRLAAISFSLGSIIVILHLMTKAEITVVIGFVYVILALGLNSFTFLFILLHGLFNFKDIKEHGITLIVMLLNLPIAYSYLLLVNI